MLLLGLNLLVALAAGPATGAVVLGEVLADPASDWDGDGEVDSKLDEWLEVRNTGAETVSLTSYYVRDGLGETPHLNLFGVLAPGEVAVFYGYHAVAWQRENGAGSSGLSLNNGGDTVQLLQVDPADPDSLLVVDEHAYPDHCGDDDRATGRVPEVDGWLLFDGLNPYSGDTEPLGTGCEPSPGVPNECAESTPVEAAAWSAVKDHWR
jgi:hypothetical protein